MSEWSATAADVLAPEAFSIAPVDPGQFSLRNFGPIRHDFQHHGLMQLPRLAQLARDLMPSRQCRFAAKPLTQTSEFHHVSRPPDGLGIDEVFERIAEPGSWVALYNVQTDPVYAGFLRQVIACAQPLLAAEGVDVLHITGFIFLSAAPAFTPFHIDRENNFWLQIRGRKILTAFDHRDRGLVPAARVEDFIVHGSLEGVTLSDAGRARGRVFEVGPGDGVYFPSTTPHMTETPVAASGTPNMSISIGVNFYTDRTRRHARVHQCNRVLRGFGVQPTEPGISAWRDSWKAPLGWSIAAARARWRSYAAPPYAY